MFLTMILLTSIPSIIVNTNSGQENQDLDDSLKTSAWNPGFNYTMIEDIPYSWIEISTTGTNFTGFYGYESDDAVNTTSFIDQGWTFTFYGTEYDYLNVSTNGWMTFTNDDDPTNYDFDYIYSYEWDDIPQNCSTTNHENHNDTACLLATDLSVDYGGSIFYQFFGAAPNRYLVVEYHQIAEYYIEVPQTMQAIFHENGDIHFQYKSITESEIWGENTVVGLDHGDLVNYNIYTNNWTQKFNNQSVAEKSVYFRLSELPPGSPPIPGADIALISLSSLIAIVIIVRKFKKSKISKF